MQAFNKYLALMLLLILVIFASGCANNNNSPGNNSSAQNNPSTQNNSSFNSDIVVTVSYQGTWNGTISDNSGNRTVQGTGNGRYNLGKNQTSITANFQKLGNDNLQLRVEILNGTSVIASQTNSNPFGSVSISRNF